MKALNPKSTLNLWLGAGSPKTTIVVGRILTYFFVIAQVKTSPRFHPVMEGGVCRALGLLISENKVVQKKTNFYFQTISWGLKVMLLSFAKNK